MSAPVLRLVFSPPSRVEAAARVRPVVSSMICAKMCLEERNTERRGRLLGARRKLRRTRSRRRKKRALALSDIGLLLLAFLAAHGFGRVFDPLAFIGLRRAVGADLGC